MIEIITDNNVDPNEIDTTNIDNIKPIKSRATQIIDAAGYHFFIFIKPLAIITDNAANAT
jgi:hypothetical protein